MPARVHASASRSISSTGARAAARTARSSCRPSRPTGRGPGSTIRPAGNVVPRITRSTCAGDRLLVADPVLDRADARRPRTRARSPRAPRSVCIAFVATMPKSQAGSSAASLVAAHPPDHLARAREPQPVLVDRATCSSARSYAQTSTSSSCARFAANSDPTAPQPTTQTLTGPSLGSAKLPPAGEPRRAQDQHERHDRAERRRAASPAGRSSVTPT